MNYQRKHELAETTTQFNSSEVKSFHQFINDQFHEKMGRFQAWAQNAITKSRNYQIKEKLTQLQTMTENVLSTTAETLVGRFLPEKDAKEMVKGIAAKIPPDAVIKIATFAGNALIDRVSEGIPDIETMIIMGTFGSQIINWKEEQNTETFKNTKKTVARKAFKTATYSLIPFPFNTIIGPMASGVL